MYCPTGKFRIEDNGDDDWMGFVFGLVPVLDSNGNTVESTSKLLFSNIPNDLTLAPYGIRRQHQSDASSRIF